MGHPGITHMRCKVCESYWWPGLNSEVHDLVKQCLSCQFSEKTTPPANVLKIEILKPSGSWKKLGLDIAGPFADAPMNQKYIVTVIDYATNYPECLLTSDICSGRILKLL